MRFLTEARKPMMPELVCSRDNSQPVLTHAHLDVESSELQATDSFMAVRYPVQLDEHDVSGPIPAEALKALRRPPRRGAETELVANSEVRVNALATGDVFETYVTVPRPKGDYKWPNLAALEPERTAEFEIGLNAANLAVLAKAMGTDVVRLKFTAGDDGTPQQRRVIVVEPLGLGTERKPSGLLMPFIGN